MAAAVGVTAYWSAVASRPVEAEPAPEPQPVPGLVPIGAGVHRDPSPTVVDQAYIRGRRAGFREGRRATLRTLRRRLGFGTWSPEAAYVVMSAPDGKGIATRVGPLKPGVRYELCRGGRRICFTRPD